MSIFIALFMSVSAMNYSATSERAEDAASVKLPVIMYHSVLKSVKGRYIVSPTQLERDFAAMQSSGYSFVTAESVIGYANGQNILPQNPILITFDDGHYNNMFYALPLLKKYAVNAVFNIVGCYSEYSSTSGDDSNPNYSHLTWSQIGELARGGNVEFGNHSFNMHKYKPRFGVGQKYGESDAEYIKALTADAQKLQSKLYEAIGYYPKVFAYPFGKYTSLTEQTLEKMGFEMFLTCNEGVSTVEFGNPDSIKLLKRFNREGSYTTETLMKKILSNER